MRLARQKGPPDATGQLVGVVPPPTAVAATDLESLFLEAYTRLHGRALDHAERFLAHEDACDAVGDAMEVLIRRWATLTPDQRTDRWVFGVVHKCVHAKLRTARRYVAFDEVEGELDAMAASAFTDFALLDTKAEILDEVLAAMPPKRREVLLLIKEEGFTYDEAAEALGVSIGTINTHMHLANKDLRTAFTRAGFRLESAKPASAQLPAPKGDATHD